MNFTWGSVAENLQRQILVEAKKPPLPTGLKEEQDPEGKYQRLDAGQRASLKWIAKRLPESGVVLADEVGTGKTRIACAVVHAVLNAGGRAAVVVPHGLMHQWIVESRKLWAISPVSKELTTLAEFLREVSPNEASWSDLSPRPDVSEWWLISHGFRAPWVGSNSPVWRAALPAFVELHLASRAERKDGRTRIGKLQCAVDKAPASWWGWNGMAQIAREIAPRVKMHPDLLKRVKALPQLNVSSWNNDALLAQFDNNGDGCHLTEELLGLWLGKFDLLVVDEAHKSRGENDENDTNSDAEQDKTSSKAKKVLDRLIENVLKQPAKTGRRLCLTATPMELELSQWIDLLKRARSDIAFENVECVIKNFQDTTKNAAAAPDEGYRLDKLIGQSKAFEKTLKDFVTRRRRDTDPSIVEFKNAVSAPKESVHPHRNIQKIPIGVIEAVCHRSGWLDVLFAAECMNQSALGLNRRLFESAIQLSEGSSDEKKQKRLKHLIRDMYSRLASGHLSADLFDADVRIVPPDDCNDVTRGKLQRTEYWRSKIQTAMSTYLHEDEHPRILAAVKEIENWTLAHEKVLVFGVFLRPLRLLRDVLNVRHALRAADAGRPIAHAVHTDPALLGIALRQLDRLRAEGALSGCLSSGNGVEMRRALVKSHRAYEGLRPMVRRRAKKPIVAWRTDPSLLGGAAVDRELEGALEDHFVSFVLDDLLATTSESDDVSDERFKALTTEFVEKRLRPLLGELGDEKDGQKRAKLRQESLRELVKDVTTRQSHHARLLDGDTSWQTRRYMQAAFNRPGASPWVLIAQSQVGREGLNLHESCRVVVQFHAEWNPAVLEQQIGRVDRKGSLWEQRAKEWLDAGAQGEPPFIEVRQLIFEGTYDALQWDRVGRRQHVFDASLFGSLLPADAWERVPDGRKKELLEAAPSFSPI
jgi:hypothetical protein